MFALANIFARRGAVLALALAGPMAMAQVELNLSRTTLMSGSQCKLTANRTDGRTPHWVWGPPEATIVTQPDGRVFFTAPAVAVPRWFTVLVTDTAVDPPQTRSKQIHGRNLFLTDPEAGFLRVFNMDTRIMVNLPVPDPRHLVVSPDGVCLLGLRYGLARLDVRAFILPISPAEGKAESKEERKAETKDEPLPPSATTLYAPPALPEVGTVARVARRGPVRPDGSFELLASSRSGDITSWAWTTSAGTCEVAGTSNHVRFKPPADARSGSVFRITALGTGSTVSVPSNWKGPSAFIEITIP